MLTVLLTAWLCAIVAGAIQPAAPAIAFVGVSVLPMDRETVRSNQTVIVREGKIAEIGPAAKIRVPDGATRVDGNGKFLMPALAEMHAHIPAGQATDADIERTLFLYAANGIGTIRGMLGDPRHLWVATKQNTIAKFPAEDRRRLLALRRRILKALHDGGVPFALGSDAPQVWNVPGFSAHRELKSMVDAGVTPYQALRMGTADVATYFGTTATTGTVTAGTRADLILLDANPLQNITNSTRIAGVVINGRWMPKAEIDQRLASGK